MNAARPSPWDGKKTVTMFFSFSASFDGKQPSFEYFFPAEVYSRFKKMFVQCLRCLGGVDAVQKLELEVRVSAIRKSKRWKESLIWKEVSQWEGRVQVRRWSF
jgi:hypothetical protein